MTGIPDADLTWMRAAINELLPGTAYVLTCSYVSDGGGGLTETWGTAGTVDCRLDAWSGNEVLTGGAVQPFHRYRMTVPYDTTLTTADRVQVDGIDYAVKSVDNGSWKLDLRAIVEKI